MIYTTLNEIRAFNPCKSGWSKLLSYLGKTQPDDEPLPLATVLDSNGLEDAIWCLRVCPDIAAAFAWGCADRAAEAAEAAYCADRADHWADRATHGATLAAEASCWASYWAAKAARATERQAQADKLRGLLT